MAGTLDYIIKVYHVYQDPHNPKLQIIGLRSGYAKAYALFMALIDSHNDFDVKIGKRKEERVEEEDAENDEPMGG